jgi:hypothetical protein
MKINLDFDKNKKILDCVAQAHSIISTSNLRKDDALPEYDVT